MSADRELARLLEHPAIWRGRSVARMETVSTGFAQLDACLPAGGWPRAGLIEFLVPRFGVGESYLLFPALSALTQRVTARWCLWIAPPLEPFAPALAAQGVALERVLVVRTATPLWAFEQALGSGACDVAMTWVQRPRAREIRRLQLAAERGRALGVLFRPSQAMREASPAALRVLLEPMPHGVSVTLLKSRGGARGAIELAWPMPS